MRNSVMQFQILSRAPEETGQFYSSLFGWTVNADNATGNRKLSTGSEDGIQGGIWPAPPQAPTFVQLFIAVEDVKDTVKRAENIGATIIVQPTMLPEGDELAILRDPQGMSFGVLRQGDK